MSPSEPVLEDHPMTPLESILTLTSHITVLIIPHIALRHQFLSHAKRMWQCNIQVKMVYLPYYICSYKNTHHLYSSFVNLISDSDSEWDRAVQTILQKAATAASEGEGKVFYSSSMMRVAKLYHVSCSSICNVLVTDAKI